MKYLSYWHHQSLLYESCYFRSIIDRFFQAWLSKIPTKPIQYNIFAYRYKLNSRILNKSCADNKNENYVNNNTIFFTINSAQNLKNLKNAEFVFWSDNKMQTYLCVMKYILMRHEIHTYASWNTYLCVMKYILMRHEIHTYASWNTYLCVINIYLCAMKYILMRHEIHTYASWYTYLWVMKYILMRHEIHTYASWNTYLCVMKYTLMRHEIHTYAPWNTCLCVIKYE